MLKLYFAGPLFSAAERQFNASLAEKLELRGFSVFLPQRDGADRDAKRYAPLTKEEKREAIFVVDRMKIFECGVFLFILDGRVPDEGASVELGMAYAQKYLARSSKIIVGLHTDSRAAFMGTKVNPMLGQSLDRIFSDEQGLFEYLDQVVEETMRGPRQAAGTVSGLSRTAF
jgi:nucleoside 2-deoxyribosyltransferase